MNPYDPPKQNSTPEYPSVEDWIIALIIGTVIFELFFVFLVKDQTS